MCGYCIGTDKIGHMFQQGRMLYQIYVDRLRQGYTPAEAKAHAKAFAQWTEGLPYSPEYQDWLSRLRFTMPEFGMHDLRIPHQYWGGRYILFGLYRLEASAADLEANLRGMAMWEWLAKSGFGGAVASSASFDICHWVNTQALQDMPHVPPPLPGAEHPLAQEYVQRYGTGFFPDLR